MEFLSGAGVLMFMDADCSHGIEFGYADSLWKMSSKKERAELLFCLQSILTLPATEEYIKYTPLFRRLNEETVVLNEQERKVWTAILDHHIENPHREELEIYLDAHVEIRMAYLAHLDDLAATLRKTSSCWESLSLVSKIPEVWLWYLRSGFFHWVYKPLTFTERIHIVSPVIIKIRGTCPFHPEGT